MNTIQSHWQTIELNARLHGKSPEHIEEMKMMFYGGAIAHNKILRSLGEDAARDQTSLSVAYVKAQAVSKELDDYVNDLCKRKGKA